MSNCTHRKNSDFNHKALVLILTIFSTHLILFNKVLRQIHVLVMSMTGDHLMEEIVQTFAWFQDLGAMATVHWVSLGRQQEGKFGLIDCQRLTITRGWLKTLCSTCHWFLSRSLAHRIRNSWRSFSYTEMCYKLNTWESQLPLGALTHSHIISR